MFESKAILIACWKNTKLEYNLLYIRVSCNFLAKRRKQGMS
jgi:hypothetical protein